MILLNHAFVRLHDHSLQEAPESPQGYTSRRTQKFGTSTVAPAICQA